MLTVLIVIVVIMCILIIMGAYVTHQEDKKERAKKAEKIKIFAQYLLLIDILKDTDYCEDEIVLEGSNEYFVIKPTGEICRVNPFKNFQYSHEQLLAIIGWFEREKPELWQESYYNFIDEKQRVKWCLKQLDSGNGI